MRATAHQSTAIAPPEPSPTTGDPMTRLSPAQASGRKAATTIGIVLTLASIPASAPLFGCDSGVFAASTTIGVMRRAAPAIGRLRDPDIAEASIPASLAQMEGLLELKPDDSVLRAMLARSYASFGYGFLEEHMEAAEFGGEASEEQIEHWRNRATLAYVRGREVALGGLDRKRPEGGGMIAIQRTGLDAFTAHVARFDNREEDAPLLFWVAYNWARYISLNRDDMSAIADVPYVAALAERVYALDATYMDHAPVALRAGLMAAAPPALGGRPQDAKVELDRAIQLTNRANLMYLVTEARLIAIPLQDRALYTSLLEEVVAFDVDSMPDQRLANVLAQRRARRYLQEVDNFFAPADEAEGADAADAAEGGEAAASE
jgi:hypothetical protein